MEWLEILAKHHKEWVTIVRSWGLGDLSEDLVQEMYLKLYERSQPEKFIDEQGYVSKFYIYVTLRNMFNDFHREKSKYDIVRMGEGFELQEDESELEKFEGFEKLCNKLEISMDCLHWYDRMMFTLYAKTDLSMRDIERETGISTTSIFHTIKSSRQQLKETMLEDYEDYNNEDYDFIQS